MKEITFTCVKIIQPNFHIKWWFFCWLTSSPARISGASERQDQTLSWQLIRSYLTHRDSLSGPLRCNKTTMAIHVWSKRLSDVICSTKDWTEGEEKQVKQHKSSLPWHASSHWWIGQQSWHLVMLPYRFINLVSNISLNTRFLTIETISNILWWTCAKHVWSFLMSKYFHISYMYVYICHFYD